MMVLRQAAIATCVLAALTTACSPDTEQGQRAGDRGESLFDKNCSACHGEQGRGPSMDDLHALEPAELRAAIRNHPTAGQIPERLPATQVQEIIDYIEAE